MNIKFAYLYRDGANYKQFGEVVFSNITGIHLQTVEDRISNCLIDGEWFYPEQWGLTDLHYFKWDDTIDHLFHEFEALSATEEQDCGIDITDFLKTIEPLI